MSQFHSTQCYSTLVQRTYTLFNRLWEFHLHLTTGSVEEICNFEFSFCYALSLKLHWN